MNIILAVSIYYIILGFSGWVVSLSSDYKDFKPIGAEVSYEKYEDVTYDGFSKNSNAKDAGMPESGVIKKVDGKGIEYTYDLERVLEGKEGSIVKVTICEKNECSDYSVKVSEQGYLGIVVAVNYYVVISYEDSKLTAGFSHLLNILKLSAERISGLFTEAKETGNYSEVANTFSGPVGIYLIIDYFKQFGFWSIISIMADLSLSLAIMNILPIPALDGGRIVILLSESIARKDLNEETEALIINISFCILMVLVAVIFVKDILTIDSLRSMFE
jgi:regulator of sigma E protease